MEAAVGNRDEERGDSVLQAGGHESAGNGDAVDVDDGESHVERLNSSEGAEGGVLTAEEEDAVDVDDGESHVERLNLSEGAEGGVLTAEEEEAVVDSEENDARDAGKGAVVDLNGIRDDEERVLQPRNRDLQLTMRLGDAVEDDARAVAKSLTTLLASLKSALSEVTGSSVEHMRTENQAAGQLQDAAIDAATKGNRFVNACLRLNEEMKGMNHVATQLESLKQRVDQFEYQSNRYLPRQ